MCYKEIKIALPQPSEPAGPYGETVLPGGPAEANATAISGDNSIVLGQATSYP
jgi:hypothetical protein